MISSVLAFLLVTSGFQGADRSAAARDAYTGCLRAFMEQSIEQRMSPDDFDSAIDLQCPAEEAVFRDAIIQREISFGGKRKLAEEDARLDVEDAKTNFRSLFRDAVEPRD